MSKVAINEITLTNIGDAIREKTGKTDLIAPGDMPTEIASITTGGGGTEVEPIVLSGNQNEYRFAGPISKAFVTMYPDKISTNDLTSTRYMFTYCELKTIPFSLNYMNEKYGGMLSNTFYQAEKLESLPSIINPYVDSLLSLFQGCYNLRYIEDDAIETWRWSPTGCEGANIFQSCRSLRHIPSALLKNLTRSVTSSSTSQYRFTFRECLHLDEILELGVNSATLKNNLFNDTFSLCTGLKRFTFAMNEDGTPKTAKWKNQNISLSYFVGYYAIQYTSYKKEDYLYNSGVTADKIIYDDATYAALKDDPDAWVCGYTYANEIPKYYSFYNHDSAVETINSLPDTSAYLASNGGTNTIKFEGEAGLKTDGGAINTLTEEEIAVATAKGWTVTFV